LNLPRRRLRQGLDELGYIEGRNIVIEYRAADGKIERLPGLATELVGFNIDLIVALATPAGRAAQQATSMIAIVVTAMGDPVRDGLVASLARPGGNITGTISSSMSCWRRRLPVALLICRKAMRSALEQAACSAIGQETRASLR
jgi:ABC-type uncharacterized transport system substrate-binding protein